MDDAPGDVDDSDQESDQLDTADTLDDRGLADALDEGYSPPDRPWAGTGWGTTPREEAAGESLDGRLAREVPDGPPSDDDGLGDTSDTDGELRDDEVGAARSGRLLADDADGDGDLQATDVGFDGAGASAEEAAVHVVPRSSEED